MRKYFTSLFLLAFATFSYGQTLTSPATNATGSSAKVIFGWDKVVSSTPTGFHIVYSSTSADLPTLAADPASITFGSATATKGFVAYSGVYTNNSYTYALNVANSVILSATTKYYWKVRQKVGTTWGSWSAAFNFTTGTPTITAPSSAQNAGSLSVVWNSFGQTATKVYLSENGTTYDAGVTATTSPTTVTLPAGLARTGAKLQLGYGNPEVKVTSGVFTINGLASAITFPTASDNVTIGNHYVCWTNNTGGSFNKIAISTDSGATWSGVTAFTATSLVTDSVQYNFPGGYSSYPKHILKVYGASDTVTSAYFPIQYRVVAVTSPTVDSSFTIGNHYVVWTNNTGKAITKVDLSLDSGKTGSGVITLDSPTTSAKDSVLYDFQGSKSLTNPVMRVYGANGDTGKSAIFSVVARVVAVTQPAAGTTTAGPSYVVWTNNTGAAVTTVKFSLDSGKTYSAPLTVNSSSAKDSVLYNFQGGRNATTYCAVIVYTASDTGKSVIFSLAKGTAAFSIPTVFGDPAGTLSVPISVANYIAGDSVKGFDIKMSFDSTYISFTGVTYNASVNNWVKIMDSSNAQTTTANFVRISAFKNTTGAGVKNSELFRLNFTVKDKQSIIGLTSPLTIVNSVLSAAGNSAASLDVSSSSNGLLKIYSSITGNIHYFHQKWGGSASYPVSGDSVIVYYDSSHTANNSWWPVANGSFNLTSREPNDTINFYPSASKYMGDVSGKISVIDATLAFKSWHDTLSTRALIAADVNEDSLVNTTDAMAIMEISVDSTYLSGLGLTNWIFVDSTSLAGFESAADSLTGWYTKHRHSMSYKLVAQRTNQNFFGVLRGDVDFDYATAAVSTMKKSNVNPVIFNTDANFNLRPGDEVWIPLNIYPSENTVAGFNASINIDPSILTYTGEFKMGQSVPQDKNWYVAAKSDSKGTLRVAATDFSLNVTPITQEGAALLFKYIVNKNAKLGSTSLIDIKTQTVADNKMQKISSAVSGGKVEITRMGSAVVTEYALAQNYPNPFNPTTTVEFALPKDSKVNIEIFNILGQKVTTLFNGDQTSGYHQVSWNASNFGSGVYFYVMNASSPEGDKFRSVKKLMLMK